VKQYLAGGIGFRALARVHGVGRTLARQWVAEYRLHGVAGVRGKARSKYSAEFKLQVLERMRQENLSQTQIQALLDIRGAGTVGRWQRQYHEGGFSALLPRPRMSTSKPAKPTPPESGPDARTREQLLKENEYLRAEVAYLKKLDALIRAEQRQTRRAKRK